MAGWHPQHSVELVAGTPAGGGQDRPARALIAALESSGLAGVALRLSNMPGRGGGNAWDYLLRHAGDPHVLAINSPTLITNRLLGVSGFDHAALTPLANLCTEYIAFVVRVDSPLTSGADLLARLGSSSGAFNIALATALGNTNHMALALAARHVGGDIRALNIRAFDSAPYAVAEVLAGRAGLGVITAVSAAKELEAGRVRALAVSAPQRLPGLYGAVPTWAEQGVDCVIGTWRGVIGAGGLTPQQIAFWEDVLADATAGAAWNAGLAGQFWTNTYLAGAQLREFLDRERIAMGALLRALGLLK